MTNGISGIGFPELLVILIFVVPGIIGALLAKNKGRNPIGWFFLSVFFWFPILIVIMLPPIKEIDGKYRECPSCKEFIKWEATICKHCGTQLTKV